MNWLQIFRLAALGFSIFSGILVLSLGAHLLSLTQKYFQGSLDYESYGIAVGVITVVTVPVMLVVDFLRTGAFTSMVLVELVWLSTLWVLWLAEGGLIANEVQDAFQTCDFDIPLLNQACNETRAMEAFSFLTWIVLLAYTIALLVVAILNHSRGAPIWTSTLKQQQPSLVVPAPAGSAYSGQPAYPLGAPAHPQMGQPQPGAQQQQAYPQPQYGSQQPQQMYPPTAPGVSPPVQPYEASPAMGAVPYSTNVTAAHVPQV